MPRHDAAGATTAPTDLLVPVLPGLLRPGCMVRNAVQKHLGSLYVVIVPEDADDLVLHTLAGGQGNGSATFYMERDGFVLDLDHAESVDAALRFLARRHLGGTDFGRPYYDVRLPPSWWWTMGHDAAHQATGRGWVLEDPAGGISRTYETDEPDAVKALADALRHEAP